MRVIVFLVKFFLLAAFFLISNHNLALIDADNRAEFVTLYGEWMKTVFGEVASITGYVVQVEWLPETGTAEPQEPAQELRKYSGVKR